MTVSNDRVEKKPKKRKEKKKKKEQVFHESKSPLHDGMKLTQDLCVCVCVCAVI